MATLPTFSTGTWSSETTVKLDLERWSFEALVGMDGVEPPFLQIDHVLCIIV